MALLSLLLFAVAGERLAARFAPRQRLPVAIATAAALLCAAYGLLGALSARTPTEHPLRFRDGRGDEVVVREERVTAPRATPRHLLPVAAAAAALAALTAGRRRWKPGRLRLPAAAGLLAAASAPYALTLFGALASPPRGYDALWYHLPTAVAFARDGHLEPPGRDLVFYFPADGALLARAALDVLGPRALAAIQWPFAVAAAAAAVALARAVGLRRRATLAAALLLGAPMVAFQSQLGYVDLIALFATATAATLLVRATRAARLPDALGAAALGGLALGLALGTKYAALPLVAAAGPALFLSSLAPRGRLERRAVPRALLVGAVVALSTLAASAFWFWRNHRLTGNPIFPIAVPSLGWRGLFSPAEFNPGKELELVGARWRWLLYPILESASHESGLGAGFAVALVGAPLAVLATVRRLVRRRLPALALPLAWGLLYLAAWWIGTPHEARHLLPLLVLLGVPSLIVFERARDRRAVEGAVTAGILFSTLMTIRALLYSTTPELSIRPRDRAALYDLSPALEAQLPDGARVVNRAGRPYNFPLLGPRLTWRPWDYAPTPPSESDLRYHGLEYLLHRGAEGSLTPGAGWTLIHRAPTANTRWWDGSPDDRISLWRLPR